MKKSIFSVFLSLCILLCGIYCVPVRAQGYNGYISGSNVALRTAPTTDSSSSVITRISNCAVIINGAVEGSEAEAGKGTIWYNITHGGQTGYVYSRYVVTVGYSADFEQNLLNFPESYREALRAIHNEYPNWQFVAHNLTMTLDEAINEQYNSSDVTKNRKFVELTYGGPQWRDPRAYIPESDSWLSAEGSGRWTYASREAIAYFMDPRNSLNAESLFVFLQQSYDSASQTKEGLRSIVNGSFLQNGYDGNPDAYLDDIMAAAAESGVSPYVLAATIRIEQGSDGASGLISGNYPGYEGCYNFFNFGASGADNDTIVRNGLDYAKGQEWTSRRASIIGGANEYKDGYVESGQDTYYYKDYNVINQVYWHQYAAAVYDAWTNAKYLAKGCKENKQAALVFKIPVYRDTSGAAIVPPNEMAPITIKRGDTNLDNMVDVKDLAAVRMHLLGVVTLQGNNHTGADANGDGAVDVKDLAAIRMHLLGIKAIQ